MALDVADRGYVLETGRIALAGRREGAARRTSRCARPTSASSGSRLLVRQPAAPPSAGSTAARAGSRCAGSPPARGPSRARRRAAVGRHEAELSGRDGVAAAGDDHGAEPVERGPAQSQSANGSRGGRCGRPGSRRSRAVDGGGALRLGESVGVARSRAARKSARYGVWSGGRSGAERVDQDRRPAVADGEGVAPEPQRQAKAEGRREQRVRPLARQVRRRGGERRCRSRRAARRARAAPLDARSSASACATEGGRVGRRRGLARTGATQRAAPQPAGRSPNTRASGEAAIRSTLPARTGSRGACLRGGAGRATATRRSAGTRAPAARSSASASSQPGARCVSSSDSAAGRALRLGDGRRRRASPVRRGGPTRRRSRSTTASVSTRARMDAERHSTVAPTPRARASSASCEATARGSGARTRATTSRSIVRRTGRRARPAATRSVWRSVGTPSRSSSSEAATSAACLGSRVGKWDRQSGQLDEDRGAAALRHERLERLAREREAQRVPHGGADVRDRLCRRRRRRDDYGGVARPDDDQP